MTNASTLFGTDTGLTVNLDHTLDNPNAASDAFFGSAVAVSGNYAVVGAEGADFYDGKAYVFNVTTGALVATLNNPNPNPDFDIFGDKVDISGNFVIVGATQGNLAYIFNATTGALIHELTNPDPNENPTGDAFGWAVGISGDYAIVTARREDEPTATNSGKAYIFDVLTGALVYTLDNPSAYGSPDLDEFGYAAAISGNYAIVGATGEDEATASSSGKAYIFNVSTGALIHTLDNPNAYGSPDGDTFGYAVGISGNYAIVGATGEDEATASSSGKAYIFNVSTGALVHTLDNPNAYGSPDGDSFGYAVDISGNYAIVSAQSEDDAGGNSSGKAYIFNITTGALVHTLDNPNAYGSPDNDFFGESVSISGNYAIVGAITEDDAAGSGSGKAYIYNLEDVPGYDASVDTIIPEELLIDPTVYTAAFVASKNRLHKLDVSGGGFTVDMPLSPIEGDRVEFRFVNGSSPATNNLTFSKGATSAEIENDTADFVWDVDGPKTVAWIYTAEDGWIIR